jgi:hypothetical protein
MGKYRIKGKFVDFKTFVKTNGLDAVNYNSLTTKEKRVWSGLNTYENRIKLDNGQFLNKNTLAKLRRDPNLKDFANKRGIPLNKYIQDNIDTILKFNEQAFILYKNNRNVEKFITESKGSFLYFGNEINKLDLIFKLQNNYREALRENKHIGIYKFEVKENGRKINLIDEQYTGSDPKPKSKKRNGKK